MNLYLVVKHRNDTTNKFKADWANDTTVNWTECNDKVLADCKQLFNTDKNGWVYLYRPAFSGDKNNMLVCKARIAKIDEAGKKVTFKDHAPMNTTATFTIENGTFSKWMDADNTATATKGKSKKTA